MPLHCTATGKVLLAFSPPTLLEEVLARPLERLTPSTVTMPGMLREQIRKVRDTGHAIELEETAIGYCSVAVPIFGSSGLLLGALSITAPTFRADTTKFAIALAEVIRKVAATRQIN
jgi:DNA-binding IclR family transcriptional regulator